MTRLGVWILLQLAGLGPVQTGPRRLAVPGQTLPFNGCKVLSFKRNRMPVRWSHQFTLFICCPWGESDYRSGKGRATATWLASALPTPTMLFVFGCLTTNYPNMREVVKVLWPLKCREKGILESKSPSPCDGLRVLSGLFELIHCSALSHSAPGILALLLLEDFSCAPQGLCTGWSLLGKVFPQSHMACTLLRSLLKLHLLERLP